MDKSLKKQIDDRLKWIEDSMDWLERELTAEQRRLYALMMDEVAGKLKTKDGKILYDQKNLNLLTKYNQTFSDFQAVFVKNVVEKFGERLMKVTVLTHDYYSELGFSERAIKSAMHNESLLRNAIGLTEAGKVKPGGYLAKLTDNQLVQQRLADYIRGGVAGNKSYDEFLSGFKQMITGSDEINGDMIRYYKQYVWDTFNETLGAEDNYAAEQLDLEYFIYSGSVIDTSREFCEKRHGKVYHRCDGEIWDTEDWKGKNEDSTFFISKGGYNCRHDINWISKELAAEIGYSGECQPPE